MLEKTPRFRESILDSAKYHLMVMLFIFTEEIIHIMSIVLKALMVKKYTVFISRVLRSTIQVLTKSSKCLFEYTQKGQEILQKENVHLVGLLFIVSFRYTHIIC